MKPIRTIAFLLTLAAPAAFAQNAAGYGYDPSYNSGYDPSYNGYDTQTYAPSAPPAVQVETPPPCPGPGLVWTPGYWYWSAAGWSWIAGAWLTPPQAGYAYIAPRWVQQGPSWYFNLGGWAPRGSYRVAYPVYRHHFAAPYAWGAGGYYGRGWNGPSHYANYNRQLPPGHAYGHYGNNGQFPPGHAYGHSGNNGQFPPGHAYGHSGNHGHR